MKQKTIIVPPFFGEKSAFSTLNKQTNPYANHFARQVKRDENSYDEFQPRFIKIDLPETFWTDYKNVNSLTTFSRPNFTRKIPSESCAQIIY